MSTLTLTHPMGRVAPLPAEAVRTLVVWASVAVMIVLPGLMSVAVLLRG